MDQAGLVDFNIPTRIQIPVTGLRILHRAPLDDQGVLRENSHLPEADFYFFSDAAFHGWLRMACSSNVRWLICIREWLV